MITFILKLVKSEKGERTCILQATNSGADPRLLAEAPAADIDLAELERMKADLESKTEHGQNPYLLHRHIGKELWRAFFEGKIGQALDRAKCELGLQSCTFVLSTHETNWLSLPWEYLYDQEHESFVFFDNRVRFVRAVESRVPRNSPSLPLKVLVVLSCPSDQPGFNTLWLKERVEQTWRKLCGPYADLSIEGSAPSRDLFLSAFEKYDVVYFFGHGVVSGTSPSLLLIEKGVSGSLLESAPVTAPEIAARLGDRKSCTKLLVLNACRSAAVAAKIIETAGGNVLLPTIVSMQLKWPIGKASDFHLEALPTFLFYSGSSPSETIAEWRSNSDRERDATWGIPTVFTPVRSLFSDAECDSLDRIVTTTALVGVSTNRRIHPSKGPLGITASQRSLLVRTLSGKHADRARTDYILTIEHQTDKAVEPFEMEIFPVTNHLFDWYVRHRNPDAHLRRTYPGEKDSHPAQVTYECARQFCEVMGGQLPTHEQWQRAARGASTTLFPWMDRDADVNLANGWKDSEGRMRCNVLESGRDGPTSVFESISGGVLWNGVGVRDLIGNVAEWATNGDAPVQMGGGHESRFLYNIPAVFYRPRPPIEHRYLGFRRVFPLKIS